MNQEAMDVHVVAPKTVRGSGLSFYCCRASFFLLVLVSHTPSALPVAH